MKKSFFKNSVVIVMAVAVLLLAAACGSSDTGGDSNSSKTDLTGSAQDVLQGVLDTLEQSGIEMPMALPPEAVSPEISQNTVGLSTSDFNNLVADSSNSLAAIGTFAHQIIVLKANDPAQATQIKNLVSGDGGYDAHKWICVWPEKVTVVESGSYVLICASSEATTDAAVSAFEAAAGGHIGTPDTFFSHEGGEAGANNEAELGGLEIEFGD